MPTAVQNSLARMRATMGGFTVAQKTIAVILIAALVLGTVALVSWLTKPSYSPLFSGIEPADASAIVEQLKADGVPYELTAGGGTILVPEEHVYQERLTAAAAGLPSSTCAMIEPSRSLRPSSCAMRGSMSAKATPR